MPTPRRRAHRSAAGTPWTFDVTVAVDVGPTLFGGATLPAPIRLRSPRDAPDRAVRVVYHSGMELSPDNPFRPDAGVRPPLRAGHEEAAAHLAWRLELIRGGKEGGAVVLYGPRGNGKTVLLWELARMAVAGRVRHELLRTRMMAGDQDALAERLAPRRGISLMGIIVRWVKKLFAGGYGLSAGVELRGPTKSLAWDALHATLQKGPVLLTVDEAHEMPADFGPGFLQAMQDFVAAGLPLLVVLAGTPGLQTHLGEMHASFWERCEKLGIGRLETVEAVREALAKPARDSGMPIDDDALESLVEESQRYPNTVYLTPEPARVARSHLSGRPPCNASNRQDRR